jgi:hypothetical protein
LKLFCMRHCLPEFKAKKADETVAEVGGEPPAD